MTGQDLKNSILQLAIQGKLVAQNANDEPANVLLERIKAEKKKLIEEKKIKKEKPLAEITEDEKPFEIPDSWVWVRLGEIAIVKSSKRVFEKDYVNEGVPFFRSKEIGDLSRKEPVKTELFITHKHFEELKEKYGIPQKNDILITSVGSIGNTWICDGRSFYYKDGNITQICNSQYFSSSYIELFLHSSVFFEQISTKVSGTAYNALTIIKLNNLILPLPPLSEQKRIVAKIEELMPLVDEYDKAQKELDTLNSAMPEKLKQSILQEAIRGKLGTNNPDDEPAAELLKRIRKEKEQLIKVKKIKKEKPLPEITDEEKPFDIPDNWVWCRLGELITIKSGDGLSSKDMKNGEIPVYGGNGVTGYHNHYNIISPTIVIGRVGYYCGSVHLTPEKAWVTDNAFITSYPESLIHREFLIYALRFMNLGKQHNATAQPVVSGKKIYPMLFPLPPLSEQKRIVTKIENLFECIEPLAKDVK